MTIYINGKFLCQQQTGTQIYAWSMLDAMRLQNIDFTVLSPKAIHLPNMFTGLKIGFFKQLNMWEQVSLPLFLLGKKDVLLINFTNSAPLFGPKQIVTVHDLAFEQKGVSWFTKGFRTWYRFLIPRLCQGASLIFTVSEFSKQEIIKSYKVSPNKIKVVPNVLPDLSEIADRQFQEDYLLVVSAENPRKNAKFVESQLDLIQAKGLKLIVVSTHSTHFKEQQLSPHPALIQLNYQSNTHYYSLLKHAKALIYLSTYEGFGIPILESLCLNTPVICLELPVFRESFGDAPIYLNELSSNAFKNALRRLETLKLDESSLQKLRSKHSLNVSGEAILNSIHALT